MNRLHVDTVGKRRIACQWKTSTQEGGKTKTHHDRSFASRSTVRCVYSALQTAREAASLREYLTRIDRRMAAGVCNGGVMCNDDAGRGSRRDVAVRRRGGQKAEGNKTVPVHSLISASPTDPCSRIGGSRDEGESCATLTPHATLRLCAGALGYFPAALFFPHDVGKCGGANPRVPPRSSCDPLRSGVARARACENRLGAFERRWAAGGSSEEGRTGLSA